jgi:phage regulator Rha-like protein
VAKESLIPAERIERSILLIRGQKVLLDSDLAELYGVATKAFNQAVKRNGQRFPADFMFQLTAEEAAALRSQFVTLKPSRSQHRKYLPYAFTEQGVAMLSSVLNSERAIDVNIAIMRAFVRLREILGTHKDLAAKLAELEKKLGEHDEKFQLVFEAIRQLMAPPPASKKRRIGFAADDGGAARAQPSGQAKRRRAAKARR